MITLEQQKEWPLTCWPSYHGRVSTARKLANNWLYGQPLRILWVSCPFFLRSLPLFHMRVLTVLIFAVSFLFSATFTCWHYSFLFSRALHTRIEGWVILKPVEHLVIKYFMNNSSSAWKHDGWALSFSQLLLFVCSRDLGRWLLLSSEASPSCGLPMSYIMLSWFRFKDQSNTSKCKFGNGLPFLCITGFPFSWCWN